MSAIPAALCLITALWLDQRLGEPRRWHPLVGFGHLVRWVEGRLHNGNASARAQIARGALGWLVLVIPPLLITCWLDARLASWGQVLFATLVLYFSIALRSLGEHARAVAQPLLTGDLQSARRQVAMIVSRDTAELDETGVARAAAESVLENGSDAVIAPLFWFLVAGAPGVVVHRLANTLDACWGYRNERYLYFGRFAARADDVLNWLPARLCALLYSIAGHWHSGVRCWRRQGHLTSSPNAGVVMAAGAGALTIRLGGGASYGGQPEQRPILGCGDPARVTGDRDDIARAVSLLTGATWLLAAAALAVPLALLLTRG